MGHVLAVSLDFSLFEIIKDALSEDDAEKKKAKYAHHFMDGLRAFSGKAWDLLIINLNVVTDSHKADLMSAFRSANSAPILALLSENADISSIAEVLDKGADVCLSNTTPPQLMINQIHALMRRYRVYNHFDECPRTDGAIIYRTGLMIDPARRKVSVGGKSVKLTPREFQLLHYFAKNPGIVLTKTMIVDRVWHTDDLTDLSSTIARLRRKIEPDPSRPVYILTEYGVGYRFAEKTSESCGIWDDIDGGLQEV